MGNLVKSAQNHIYSTAIKINDPDTRATWKSLETKLRFVMMLQFLLCVTVQFVFAAATDSNDAASLITNLVSVMISIFKYVGIALIIWGIIQFLLAVKKSDAESKSEAVTTVVVGIALVGLATIVKGMGIAGLGEVSNDVLDGGASNSGGGGIGNA